MRWAGHAVHMIEIRSEYKQSVRKPGGKITLVRPKHRREKILKWILNKEGCGADSTASA
jgi:hypothetical protein